MAKQTTLVHIPANTMLEKKNEDGQTTAYTKLEKPVVAIMFDRQENKCRVLHDSQYWTCRSKDVYEVRE